MHVPYEHAVCFDSQSQCHKTVRHRSHQQTLAAHAQVKLDELEKELQELNGNAERLGRSHAELLELQLVLEIASQFFDDAQHSASSAQDERVDAFGGNNLWAS
jgi:hypothetical protein